MNTDRTPLQLSPMQELIEAIKERQMEFINSDKVFTGLSLALYHAEKLLSKESSYLQQARAEAWDAGVNWQTDRFGKKAAPDKSQYLNQFTEPKI